MQVEAGLALALFQRFVIDIVLFPLFEHGGLALGQAREYAFGQFVHLLRASYFLDVAADHAAALNVLLWSLLFSLCLGFSLCFGFCALVLLWVLPLVFFLLKCVAGSMLCSSPEVGVCAVAHFSLFSPL